MSCRPWDKAVDRASSASVEKSVGSGSKRPRPAKKEEDDYCNNDEGICSSSNAAAPMPEPPHVTVDGTKYYSDRFYLCRPSGLVDDGNGNGNGNGNGECAVNSGGTKSCTCGHHNPPPLLDRSRLIHNLVRGADGGGGLAAAILGTYTFDPHWMTHELPDLFPTPGSRRSEADCAIPTLVLHGHKGLKIYRRVPKAKDNVKKDDTEDTKLPAAEKEEDSQACGSGSSRPSSRVSYTTESHQANGKTVEVLCLDSDTDDYDGNEDTGSNTATKSTKSISAKRPVAKRKKYQSDDEDNDTDDEDNDLNNVKEEEEEGLEAQMEDVPPEEGWRRDSLLDSDAEATDDDGDAKNNTNRPKRQRIFADSVHITEVLATWLPPHKVNGPMRTSMSNEGSTNSGARRTSGSGTASSPVTLDDSSDEECDAASEKKNVIVIDSSDEDDDDAGDVKVRIKEDVGATDASNSGSGTSPASNRTSDDGMYDPSLCVHPDIVKRREGRVGVSHPKFMLLFERRGSIVVVVTTTNLTRMGACEGMWVQRFEARRDLGHQHRFKSEGDFSLDGGIGVSSDFGPVLVDFLKRQADASQANRLTPTGFLRKFLGFSKGVDDLWKRYCFEDAQVHLIPTVPGDWTGPRRKQGNKSNPQQTPSLYGPQKIAEILAKIRRKDKKLQKNGKPPSFISTSSDRLSIQATSFGGYWTRQNMEAICKSYLGPASLTHQVKGDPNGDTDEDADSVSCDILDSLDIYWPSMSFFKSISEQKTKRRKLDETVEEEIKDYAKHDPMKGFYCFHSSQNFNTNDLSVISRMVQYVPTQTPQIPVVLCPHIKTVARILGDYYENDSRFEHSFSWFMLTSACLSRGAQGRIPEMRGFEADADLMSYSNFELGVLFCSTTGGGVPGQNRLYGFRPKECQCLDNAPESFGSLVHLPVPYQLRAAPYQPDEDDAAMCETPFFHELSEGVGSAGHICLTPLGQKINEKACMQK